VSLELGELSTVLSADDRPLAQGLDRAHDRIQDSQRQFQRTADQGGTAAGQAGGDSFAAKIGPLVKTGAVAAGAAAGLALGYALTSALDLEAANDKLAAQLNLSEAESERIGGVAGKLYADAYGESIQEVNGAVAAVISSIDGMGERDADLEGMTAKVLDLSKAFEIDAARAAQVAGQAITSGLADDGTEAVDLLTVALQKVPAAVRDDLVDALDEYGPFMSSIGVTGEKAFGLLVQGAQKGMYGIDKTGDALKEFTIRATDMSTASKVGFDALGMSQEKMSRRLLKGGADGAKAFDEIINGLLKIKDPVEQSQAALALFGTPLEDLSVQEIPKFLGSLKATEDGMGDVAGAAEKMGDKLNDNAASKIESFKRKALGQLTEMGGQIIGWAEEVMQNPAVKDFLGDVERVINERVVPALRSFWQWIQDKVMPTVKEIRENAIDKLREAWDHLSQKIEDNREQLETVGNTLKTIAEWIIQNVMPVLYDLYYTGFVKLSQGIGLVVDWIGFMVTAFRKGRDAVGWVGDKAGWLLGKLNDLRKKISFSGMFDGIKSAFKSAINWVIEKWNSISFSIPKVGPFGGGTIGTPDIPKLAVGGDVLRSGLALIHAGERVVPAARVKPLGGMAEQTARQLVEILLRGEFRVAGNDLVVVIRKEVEDRGGDVQHVLGSRR